MSKYGTVLIADDNTSILTAMRYLLDGTFERILTLTQPDDILKTMAQEEIDLVLLDMNFSLGVNSGQEGLFWLRAIRKQHPQTPVVLLTAYADVALAVKGLKSGAADFITKPWDNDELIRKLKDVLDMQQEIVSLDEVEKEHIRKTIDHCHGNFTQAAELLGISRQTLYNKIKASLPDPLSKGRRETFGQRGGQIKNTSQMWYLILIGVVVFMLVWTVRRQRSLEAACPLDAGGYAQS